jgi:hypothetical protein
MPYWPLTAGGGGGGFLAYVDYKPTNLATYTTTSQVYAAVDSTNLSVSFTAPASGSVIIMLNGVGRTTSNNTYLGWGVGPHGGAVVGNTTQAITVLTNNARFTAICRVTGLTPGVTYTYDWFFNSSDNTNTGQIQAQLANQGSNPAGPASMTVLAA